MDAKRCRAIRAALGMTQEQFAAALGTTRTTVSRWEAELSRITEPMARLIERVAQEQAAKRRK
jgi:DNA-binding transcriptional regulator YiaG